MLEIASESPRLRDLSLPGPLTRFNAQAMITDLCGLLGGLAYTVARWWVHSHMSQAIQLFKHTLASWLCNYIFIIYKMFCCAGL